MATSAPSGTWPPGTSREGKGTLLPVSDFDAGASRAAGEITVLGRLVADACSGGVFE